MATYDRAKLVRLIEQRRAAHLLLTDLSDRWREAKGDRSRYEAIIRDQASYFTSSEGHVDWLLSLPLNEAFALTAEQVQGYERQVGSATERRAVTERQMTGVNFGNYRNYIEAKEREGRLRVDMEASKAQLDSRFGIVSRLRDAVRSWGFSDPASEV